MIKIKQITIRYKTNEEMTDPHNPFYDTRNAFVVLIDGVPIPSLYKFSITIEGRNLEPIYNVEQYMDYPVDDEEYCQ